MSKTTLDSDLAVTMKIVQYEIKTLRDKAAKVRSALKDARANAKVEKTIARQAKQNVATVKKAERIAKLEAKLLALKTGPVGIKARKANKKPSKVTVTKIAA